MVHCVHERFAFSESSSRVSPESLFHNKGQGEILFHVAHAHFIIVIYAGKKCYYYFLFEYMNIQRLDIFFIIVIFDIILQAMG